MGSKKPSKLDILKIKDLKAANRDRNKANKQNIRYYSIDSDGHNYSVAIIITSATNPYFDSVYSYE